MAIVSYTLEEIKKLKSDPNRKSRTDWERLKNMTDDDIVYDDDSPKLSTAELKQFRRVGRPKSETPLVGIYLRLEPETVKALRSSGPKWQARMREQIRELVRMGAFA